MRHHSAFELNTALLMLRTCLTFAAQPRAANRSHKDSKSRALFAGCSGLLG